MTPVRCNLDRWLDDEIARACAARERERNTRDERLCTRLLLAMLLVCCCYFAFTCATDDTVPSAPSSSVRTPTLGRPAPREASWATPCVAPGTRANIPAGRACRPAVGRPALEPALSLRVDAVRPLGFIGQREAVRLGRPQPRGEP